MIQDKQKKLLFFSKLAVVYATLYMLVKHIVGCYGNIYYEKQVSKCLPWNVYWYSKEKFPVICRNDLVLFPAKNMQPVIKNGMPIAKIVVGIPGDIIEIKNGNVFINNVFIVDVRYRANKLNKPINNWDKKYRLKNDELFLLGSEKSSWDSRYWGPYPARFVYGHLQPLF